MPIGRIVGLLTISLLCAETAWAQTPMLAEAPKVGEGFKIEIATQVKGNLRLTREGKPVEVPIDARSEHVYLEKVLKEADGLATKTARRYEKCASTAKIGNERVDRNLRGERTLIVAQRTGDQRLCYSPGGPLTRTEMEVAGEHFDTLTLAGLLPGKEVAIGDTWNIPNATAQTLCQFDGLIGHTLKGTFVEVKEGMAIMRIVGDASGIEAGAQVKLDVDGRAEYDLLNHRLVKLNWTQSDERDQGPVSAAATLKCTVELKRIYLAEEPKELAPAALIGIPGEDDPPALLKLLALKDMKGTYTLLHGRDWHVVSQSENHIILRLMNRGELVVQAALLPWDKLPPGQKVSVDDFKKAVAGSRSWQFEEILEAGQVASDDDRWIYRIVASGQMDGMKVVQGYYLIVSPKGDHLLATFTTKAGNAAKVGTRDVELVNSIEFKK